MIKLIIFTITLITISGCLKVEDIAQPLKSDASLKKVQRIQIISDTTAIALEWLPFTDSSSVVGYKIYRVEISENNNNSQPLKLVATINDKIASHYVDKDLKPNTTYKYKLTIFTNDNRESLGSKPVLAKTLNVIQPIHYIISIGDLAKKTKLIWRPHKDSRVSGYIIERNDIYNNAWVQVGELDNRLNVEFIDTALETNKVYKYRIRVKTFYGLVSEPSKVVDIPTKALPKPIVDITASTELPKEIKVSWRASDEIGIAGYKIYRSAENSGDYDLVDEVKSNSYSDQMVEDGKQVFYKISAVDKHGLESILNQLPIMGNSLFKPKPPKIIKIDSSQKDIFIKWKPTDPRTLRYKLIRKSGNLWSKKDEIVIEVDKTNYIDKNVMQKVGYSYQIIAIDKFGVESLPTEESEIFLREISKGI